jgi:hypothetical protein
VVALAGLLAMQILFSAPCTRRDQGLRKTRRGIAAEELAEVIAVEAMIKKPTAELRTVVSWLAARP